MSQLSNRKAFARLTPLLLCLLSFEGKKREKEREREERERKRGRGEREERRREEENTTQVVVASRLEQVDINWRCQVMKEQKVIHR